VDKELLAIAYMGGEAESFCRSEIGEYLLGRAKQAELDAVEGLASVSPWRRNRIRTLQNEIWRARAFQGWLAELITDGRMALEQLESEDHD
jgi:hypothetical protein